MKTISFSDAYGLNLIASNPATPYRANILRRLSPEAQKIAKAIESTPAEAEENKETAANNVAGSHPDSVAGLK